MSRSDGIMGRGHAMDMEVRDTGNVRMGRGQDSIKTVREEILSCDVSELAAAYAVLFADDCPTMARTISRIRTIRKAIADLRSQIASGSGDAPKVDAIADQDAERENTESPDASSGKDDGDSTAPDGHEAGSTGFPVTDAWFTTVYRTVPIVQPDESECPFQLEAVSFPAADVDMIPGFVAAYGRHGDDLPAWSGSAIRDASGHAIRRFEFYSMDMSPAWRLLSSRLVLPDETGVDHAEALAAVLRELTFFGWGIDEADEEKGRLADTLERTYEAMESGKAETVDAGVTLDCLREKYGLGPRKPTHDDNGRLLFQDVLNENYDAMMECVRGIYRVLRG